MSLSTSDVLDQPALLQRVDLGRNLLNSINPCNVRKEQYPTTTYYFSSMSRVLAAPEPPTEVYDVILDSSTDEDVIFLISSLWLQCDIFFAMLNILNSGQRRVETSSTLNFLIQIQFS